MVTWQSLSKQAEQLSWRDRLALIWQLVRSLLGQSGQSAADIEVAPTEPKTVAELLEGQMGVISLNFQNSEESTTDVWLEKHMKIRETAGKPWE
jgi:hypothetical protein